MFLVCGEALYDVFCDPVDAHSAMTMRAVVGGSPLNIAVGLARLGRPAGLLAGISTDRFGQQLYRHVEREGVSTRFLRLKANPTPLSLVHLSAGGVPEYTFYGRDAADISLTDADMPAPGGDISGIHIGSYPLVAGTGADALAQLAIHNAHRLVTLDPNVRLTIAPDIELWRTRLGALVPVASVIKASEEDLALLYPGAAYETVAKRWLAQGPALVVVTRGPAGAEAFRGTERLMVPAPEVTVVDTVGAGDTFQAALIDGLLGQNIGDREGVSALETRGLEAILIRAARAGAITCSRRGSDLPRLSDLEAL